MHLPAIEGIEIVMILSIADLSRNPLLTTCKTHYSLRSHYPFLKILDSSMKLCLLVANEDNYWRKFLL